MLLKALNPSKLSSYAVCPSGVSVGDVLGVIYLTISLKIQLILVFISLFNLETYR